MLPFDATFRTPLVLQCRIHYDTMPVELVRSFGLQFPETLENHLLTSDTPLPDLLFPVEDPADPSLQFR